MDVHKNARTTPHSRALIAQRVATGESAAAVARAVGVCDRTVHKWVARAAEGALALDDRSCRPQRSPRAISAGLMVEIQRLRQRRWTGAVIAEAVGLSRATVARTLGQLGLARLPAVETPPAGRRYEWERPGQLLHVDIKKLGRIDGIGHRITGDRRRRARGIGWEFVHVCIDDCSRLAYAEVLSDEQSVTVAGFLRVLLKNQRLSQLGVVAVRFGQILDERGGLVAAHVTTARPIPEELKNSLYETLAAATGRKVRLSFSTDETIIGGLVARVGSTIFDGSVQSQLDRLASEMAGQ